MEFYILNPDLQTIGILDGFASLIWVKRFIQFGDCEVYIPATRQNVDLLKKGNLIVRSDDPDMVCRIRSIELETNAETGDFLIVKGEDCRAILNQRIVWKQTNFKGNAGSFINRLIEQNIMYPTDDKRRIEQFSRASMAGFTDKLTIQTTFDPVGDKIIEVCQMFQYGSKVTLKNGFLTFSLYRGVDRSYGQDVNPYIVFSNNFENLVSTHYSMDTTDYRSIALVGGVGEGNKRHRATSQVGDYSGIDRFEMFVDADDISNEMSFEDLVEMYPQGYIITESGKIYYEIAGIKYATLDSATEPTQAVLEDDVYHTLLIERGNERLAETGTVVMFDGEVEPNYLFEYGKDYFLGDVVTVINDYGIEANARITEVIESFNETGHSIIPTFEYIEVN